MRELWPPSHEGFGRDAFEWWQMFNGLLPGGAWAFIKLEGKRPIESWPQPQRERTREMVEALRGWRDNIGYPAGLQPGGWHLVFVDYDPRTDGADDSLLRLRELGLTVRTVTTLTGGEPQGQHLWFRSEVPVRKGTIPGFPGIDIVAEGAQIVLPPSVTAHRYDFEYGWSLDGTDIAPLCDAVLNLVAIERAPINVHDVPDALHEARVLLEKLGFHTYTEHRSNGAVWAEMVRPGKEWDGRGSCTIGKLGNPSAVHVFSTNAPIPAGSYNLATLRTYVGEPARERVIVDAIPIATPAQVETHEPAPEPPVPLEAVPDLPTFPVHVFPEWLRQFVTQLAHATQTPVDLPAMIVLAALAAAAGGRMIAVPRSGWEEPTNLYVAVAMPPASRKSPVFRPVIEPLRLAERGLMEATREAIASARAEKQAAEQRAKQLLNEASKAKGEDEAAKREQAVAAQLLADAIDVPTLPRIVCGDATPEALTSLLATYGGRIAMLTPEANVFDHIGGRYSRKVSLDVYLNGHIGDALHVDRIGRPPEYIARPSLTIGITTQPATFRNLANVHDVSGRGLLGRFLWAMPKSTVGHRIVGAEPVEDAVRDTYTERLRALAESLAGWESDPYRVTFTPEAGAALRVFESEIEPRLDVATGDLGHVGEWAGKLVGHTARIAALLHLGAHAEGEHWRSSVTGEHVRGAIEVAHYLTAHALAVFAFMRGPAALEGARAVLTWAEAQEGTWSQREAHRALQARFRTVDEVAGAIGLLVDLGHVEPVETPRHRTGRPASPRFRVAFRQ